MTLKVGLLVGNEWTFPPALIREVNRLDQGVMAEHMKLGGTRLDEACRYAIIIDRASHEVPYYRTYLKHAVLEGVSVINNPFMWSADDKFFEASLATRLGIACPKTVVLPNKAYISTIVHPDSLRNLRYPIDWEAFIEYVGLPCVLKNAHGSPWKEVHICHSLDEVLHHYDNSGQFTMLLQEFIAWECYVRCICLGQEEVLPIKYNPDERKHYVEHDYLSPALGRRITEDSLKLVRALGYDINSIEWAIRGGIPYAIDFMDPVPDLDINTLTGFYFNWVVEHLASLAIRLAKRPSRQNRELRWDTLLRAIR